MADADIRQHIDRLLATRKAMTGIGGWSATDRDGQRRWGRPLAEVASGEISGLELIVDAYPREPDLKFALILKYGVAICRVDYAPDASHLNKGNPALGLMPELIRGPHAHLWADNSSLVRNTLPKELEIAQLLPANVRGFENAFRWFCGEINVICRAGDLPELPGSDVML